MTGSRRLLIGCVAVLLMAAACGDDDDDDAAGESPSPSPLAGTAWFLQPDSLDVEFPEGMEDVVIAFSTDGGVAGHAGCNNYTGRYTTTEAGDLTFSQLATTRKMCEEPVMAVEAAYLRQLDLVTGFEVSGDELTLTNVDGDELLRYTEDT